MDTNRIERASVSAGGVRGCPQATVIRLTDCPCFAAMRDESAPQISRWLDSAGLGRCAGACLLASGGRWVGAVQTARGSAAAPKAASWPTQPVEGRSGTAGILNTIPAAISKCI
jgi:hypothetical protein